MADITDFTHGDDWDREEGKSKTQIKKEMLLLQALGEELVALSPAARAKIPMEQDLALALALADKLVKKHEAYRRHMQFIGRVMRNTDLAPIERALAVVRNTNQAATRKFHLIEDWRDKLLASNDAVTEFIAEYPQVEVQQLRTLIRNAKKEQEKQQPGKSYRELFQLIKPAIIGE
jgi:ribosome-associated protein